MSDVISFFKTGDYPSSILCHVDFDDSGISLTAV